MTLASTTRKWIYTGTGATDTYAYTTRIRDDDHLTVTEKDTADVETTLTKTTDYTVTGVGNDTGGNVVLVAGNLTNNHVLTIEIIEPLTQTTDIRNQGSFFPETHEDSFDHFIRIDQQQQDSLDRSVKIPTSLTTSDFDPELPAGISGKVSSAPITNSSGDGWAAVADWPSSTDISTASASAAAAAVSAAAAASAAGTLSPYGINNLGLSSSVAASALTIALKQADGSTDPASGTGGVIIYFRSSTLTEGSMTGRTATSAISITVPSGATLGHNDGKAGQVHLYALDNAGTIELAVSASRIWSEGSLHTTTTINTSADDASTLYSATGRSNVAVRYIGSFNSNQTTAGTWDSAMTVNRVGFLANIETVKRMLLRSAAFAPTHRNVYLVDTSGGTVNCNLPDPVSGFQFEIKDQGSAATNNITLVRNASENIEGTAANYTLDVDLGHWTVMSVGGNWWVLSSASQSNDTFVDKTSVTEFVEATSGSTTIPTSWASPTLAAANLSAGTAVTRSTNTLTFPYTGIYRVSYDFGMVQRTATGNPARVAVRFRNTSDSTTAAMSTVMAHDDDEADNTQYNFSGSFLIDVTNIAKNYEFQWVATEANTTVTEIALDSEDANQWRFIIERVGDT